MDREDIHKKIISSNDRMKIEESLKALFGESDIRLIDHPNLDVFVRDLLPLISPDTFQRTRHGGK